MTKRSRSANLQGETIANLEARRCGADSVLVGAADGSGATEASDRLLAERQRCAARDRRRLLRAVAVAAALHLGLLAWQLPSFAGSTEPEPGAGAAESVRTGHAALRAAEFTAAGDPAAP